jgi:hypothetical protein
MKPVDRLLIGFAISVGLVLKIDVSVHDTLRFATAEGDWRLAILPVDYPFLI